MKEPIAIERRLDTTGSLGRTPPPAEGESPSEAADVVNEMAVSGYEINIRNLIDWIYLTHSGAPLKKSSTVKMQN